MNIIFNNGFDEPEKLERARKHLAGRAEDLEFFSKTDNADEETFLSYLEYNIGDISTVDELETLIKQHREMGSFHEYGLNFDFVAASKDGPGFYRYQFSWGGPSDELRFYEDGDIHYVFLDWFVGIGFDVTGEDWAEFAREWFDGCGMMNWDELDYEDRYGADEEE